MGRLRAILLLFLLTFSACFQSLDTKPADSAVDSQRDSTVVTKDAAPDAPDLTVAQDAAPDKAAVEDTVADTVADTVRLLHWPLRAAVPCSEDASPPPKGPLAKRPSLASQNTV